MAAVSFQGFRRHHFVLRIRLLTSPSTVFGQEWEQRVFFKRVIDVALWEMEGWTEDLFMFIAFIPLATCLLKKLPLHSGFSFSELVWTFISVSLIILSSERNVAPVTKKNDLFYSLAITQLLNLVVLLDFTFSPCMREIPCFTAPEKPFSCFPEIQPRT